MGVEDDEFPEEDDVVYLVGFGVLMTVAATNYIYHRYSGYSRKESNRFATFATYFPETSANIVCGIVIGAILKCFHVVEDTFSFDSSFFFEALLPPILFSAAFIIRKDLFFLNFSTIFTYAFLGTAITAFFIGTIIYNAGCSWGAGYDLCFVDSMMLGTLISATDTAATVSILEGRAIDPELYVLLLGESLLNDAVAAVLFEQFKKLYDDGRKTTDVIGTAIGMIVIVGLASMAIGFLFGLAQAYAHKKLELKRYGQVEIFFFLVSSFLPYYVADFLGCSGILAVVFCGVMSDQYTFYHLSEGARITVSNTVITVSHFAEHFVFVYLGMALFDEDSNDYNGGLIVTTLLLCLLGRAISVLIVSRFINRRIRSSQITYSDQMMLWLAGLRGPVAFALALAVPGDTGKARAQIICTTLVIAFFTTVIMGGSTPCILDCLDMEEEEPSSISVKPIGELLYDDPNHWFGYWDKRFLRPIFGNMDVDMDWEHHKHHQKFMKRNLQKYSLWNNMNVSLSINTGMNIENVSISPTPRPSRQHPTVNADTHLSPHDHNYQSLGMRSTSRPNNNARTSELNRSLVGAVPSVSADTPQAI